MRVLYLAERFFPFVGGIESMSEHLLRALQSRGYEVLIVTSHCDQKMPDRDEWRGMPVHRLEMLTSLSRRDIRAILETRARMREIKAGFRPEIAHLQFSGPSPIFHFDTQSPAPVPTVLTLHSVAASATSNRSLFLDVVGKADWIAPVSAHMRDWTLGHAPDASGKTSVVYNGIPDGQVLEDLPDRAGQPASILWVGRMVEWKRVDRLVDAFAILRTQGHEVQLVLAGDGPERSSLEQRVADAGLEDHVTFTGWVDSDQRSALMKTASVFAIPSEANENLPMAALEASGHALPIVGSAVSGLPEIVEHDGSGLLIENIDPASLADALKTILTRPDLAEAMGIRAREIVRQRFSMNAMVEGYIGIYEKLREAAS
ncbi:glycosyltransferase family 4 protein [Aurantiacibacter sp. MUD11]|uniref:glycosyltransferase family 4 protein n=1 Tax=Aurantiacibacter sp. MUD11 TaxID=3003265 RepID=UPI0022AB0F0C|nr:glycosyltransferase family 4 protein [Aurantiacibacter sp. MUD11]WAT18942.1 glycosyltransferase family 4 protein [Aurantiacibacter sp. MUD11]